MDIKELTARGYALKNKIDSLEEEVKGLNEELRTIQNQLAVMMKEQGVTSFKHADGTVVFTTRFTVKNPTDPADKEAFFEYLKQKNIFEDMVSVNSQKLNSWYKAEMEVAKNEGNFDFKIPGLGEPSALEIISFRKG